MNVESALLGAYIGFGLGYAQNEFLIRWYLSSNVRHRVMAVMHLLYVTLVWPVVAYMEHDENVAILKNAAQKYSGRK